MLIKVNSPSSGHWRDLKLMSSLPRVHNSESLFKSKCLYFIFAWDFAAILIIAVCVIAGCLQDRKEMVFQQKFFVKVLFYYQNDQSGQGPASQFWLLESALECGVKLTQGFSLIRKWTFAVVIITQLLLYSHFLLVIGGSMAEQERIIIKYLLLLLLLLSY